MPEFYPPKSIVQFAEYPDQNISWSNNQADPTIVENPDYNFADPNNGAGDRNVIQTVKNLTHVPNPTRGPKLDKTYFLRCTNFGIVDENLSGIITGISVTVTAQRNGRIVDDTVSLVYQGEIISENKTNLSTIYGEGHIRNDNVQTYGGENDLWGAEITPEMVKDPSFGILLRFSSNPIYPHRSTIELYKILLTIHPFNVFVLNPDASIEFIQEDAEGNYFIPE